ncbi:unnamed protein product [Brachionus calyciflorus]|uniref:Uncharacterized protein n=1 Tax=Brachionus calyciflorus TaxID=104777 RepID=A0A813VMT7_9BILA|nr:unnamed protein product [Brachionus calyciflorus]
MNNEVIIDYKIIQESPSEFPSFTFCNINPFDVLNENTTGLYILDTLRKNSIPSYLKINTGEKAIDLVEKASSILKASVVANKTLSEDYVKKLGFSLETMIISCYYDNKECNTSDFYYFRDSEFGNCYTFNWITDNTNMYRKSYETSKTGNAPFSDCKKSVDSSTQIDSLYLKLTLNISKYSKILCYEICVQYELIIPRCGCGDPSVPLVDKMLLICSNLSSLECVKNVREKVKNLGEFCEKYCPSECDSLIYTNIMSLSAYPSVYYTNILRFQSNVVEKFNPIFSFNPTSFDLRKKREIETSNKNGMPYIVNDGSNYWNSPTPPTPEQVKSSVLSVSVFYDDLNYVSIEEKPAINLETLFGLIGGQFGLYIGASFLTFLEIVEFIINVSIEIYRLKKSTFKTNKVVKVVEKESEPITDTRINDSIPNKE